MLNLCVASIESASEPLKQTATEIAFPMALRSPSERVATRFRLPSTSRIFNALMALFHCHRKPRYVAGLGFLLRSFASCHIYAFPRTKKYMERKKAPTRFRFPETCRGDASCTSADSSSQDAPPCYRKIKWNCASLRVATGEHIALRRGPRVG